MALRSIEIASRWTGAPDGVTLPAAAAQQVRGSAKNCNDFCCTLSRAPSDIHTIPQLSGGVHITPAQSSRDPVKTDTDLSEASVSGTGNAKHCSENE